jgi:phosphonate transport system substrate-binding protein
MPFKTLKPTALAAAALAPLLFSPAQAADRKADEDKEILFGIVPQQSASRLAQVWIPLMNRLAQETALRIRFATTKDIPTFERCLAKGAYELAYMNPYHYVVFHKKSGYQAFARQAKKRLQGLIVVKADSAAKDLADLNGATFAFPSPAAFGASILPRAEMRARGIEHEPKYVKSHDSVYRAVAAGLYPAGGGVKRTFGNIPEDLRNQLRVIYTTDAYTPHAFAASPALSAGTVARISAAMTGVIGRDAALMTPLGMKGLDPAKDEDWNDVRALQLTHSETEIADEGTVKCRSD